MTMVATYFISGHLDLTIDEFKDHYEPAILKAIDEGSRFVVGDAIGADHFAQELLRNMILPSERFGRINVFHMLTNPRNLSSLDFDLFGGYDSDESRDAAMTKASTDDIAWVRPSKKTRKSGTAKNLERRRNLRWEARKAEIASWPEYHVARSDDYYSYTVYAAAQAVGPATVAHLPADLVERMRVAYREYLACQSKVRQLVDEQGIDP